jgi:hypothetical protein
MATLLKHDRACLNLLQSVDPAFTLDLLAPELPKIWNGPHVGVRISEGFATLRVLPMNGHMHSLASKWPSYCYEFDDLLAQAETAGLERTMRIQNQARVQPSVHEVTVAIAATYWPALYLGARPELCTAVNAVGLAHSFDRDAGWVVRNSRARGGRGMTRPARSSLKRKPRSGRMSGALK